MNTAKTRAKNEPVTHVRYKKIAPKTVPYDVYERDVAEAEEAGMRHAERYAESMLPEKLAAAGMAAVARHIEAEEHRSLEDVDLAQATVKHAAGILRMLTRVIENDPSEADDLMFDVVSVAHTVATLLDGAAKTLVFYANTRRIE